MYAKLMIEYARAHAAERGWSRHLYSSVPVAMALAVAVLPFALKREAAPVAKPRAAAQPSTQATSKTPLAQLVVLPDVMKRAVLPLDQSQRAVASYITRKYGVSADVVSEFVRTAYAAARQYGVDPLLVVSMMAVESSFNPIAESYAGAKGLMQIIPRYHPEKFVEFGGEQSVFDPRVNILVGARIVREYLLAASGDLFTALQTYSGGLADKQAVYTNRVLDTKDQLDEITGAPKMDRAGRVVQIEPMGKLAGIRAPSPMTTAMPVAPPAPTPELLNMPPVPAAQPAKPAEEAAHTPPTTVVPPQAAPQLPSASGASLT